MSVKMMSKVLGIRSPVSRRGATRAPPPEQQGAGESDAVAKMKAERAEEARQKAAREEDARHREQQVQRLGELMKKSFTPAGLSAAEKLEAANLDKALRN